MTTARRFLGLVESAPKTKKPLVESTSPPEIPLVEIQERVVEDWACPHCHEVLHEKGGRIVNLEAFTEGREEAINEHSCGGHYRHPPMSEADKAWINGFFSP